MEFFGLDLIKEKEIIMYRLFGIETFTLLIKISLFQVCNTALAEAKIIYTGQKLVLKIF